MKKIIVIFTILTLILTGCIENSKQDPNVANDNSANMGIKTKGIKELAQKLSEVEKSTSEVEYYQLKRKTIGEVSIQKKENAYDLEVTINNAVYFGKEEIEAKVKHLKNEEIEEEILGAYTIRKYVPDSLKEYLDGIKSGEVSSLASSIWKDYSDTNWLNENGIPVFIEDENGNALYVLKNIDENEPEKYYLFRVVIAGQEGFYSVQNDEDSEKLVYSFNPTDNIEWREYDVSDLDGRIKEGKTMTFDEYFNNNYSGDFAYINEKIKTENGKLVLELYNGGN